MRKALASVFVLVNLTGASSAPWSSDDLQKPQLPAQGMPAAQDPAATSQEPAKAEPAELRARILATQEKRIALAEQSERSMRLKFETVQSSVDSGRASKLDLMRAANSRFEAVQRTLQLRLELADTQARFGRAVGDSVVDGLLAQQLRTAEDLESLLVRTKADIDAEYNVGRQTILDLAETAAALAAAQDHVLRIKQAIDERNLARAERQVRNGK